MKVIYRNNLSNQQDPRIKLLKQATFSFDLLQKISLYFVENVG